MASVTVEELLQHVKLDPGDLERRCMDDDLERIALVVPQYWEKYAPSLGLSDTYIAEINAAAKLLALLEWYGFKATFRCLVNEVW